MILDSFIWRAGLAGVGVAAAAAPLGCFVVWRRMAYFGDATAHAAILGVALALSADLPVFLGALVIALAMASMVSALSGRDVAVDTLLGVLAHSALAIGIVAVSLLDTVRIDLMAFLFGDILAVSRMDLLVIWGGALAVIGLLSWRWSALLTATLNEDLARASGIDPNREKLILTLTLAVVVAVSIKVVGVLLIGAMLIVPPAAARVFARTPEQMAVYAGIIGMASAVGGLWMSWEFDTPTGPTIVSVAAAVFVVCTVYGVLRGVTARG
jgi:zinc transport system permease protein